MPKFGFVGTPYEWMDYGLPLGRDLDENSPPGWNTESGSDPMRWIDYINSGGLDLRWADLQGVNLLDFDLRDAKLDFAILHNHPSSSVSGYAPPKSEGSHGIKEGESPRLPEKHLIIWKIVNGFYRKPDPEIDLDPDINPRRWFEGHYFQCEYDLRGSDLSNAVFSNTHAGGWDMGAARGEYYWPKGYMKKANLERANLSRSIFRGAELDGANLKEADLSWAKLEDCCFHFDANLRKANLSHSTLHGANFYGSDLSYANLSWARGLNYPHSEAENPHGLEMTKMTGAHLYGHDGYKIRRMGAQIDESAYEEMLEDDETYGIEEYDPHYMKFTTKLAQLEDPDWKGVVYEYWQVDGTYTEFVRERVEIGNIECDGFHERTKINGDKVKLAQLSSGEVLPSMSLYLAPTYNTYYIGAHEKLLPHGVGCWTYAGSGGTISGIFENGEMNGIFRVDVDGLSGDIRFVNGEMNEPDTPDELKGKNFNPLTLRDQVNSGHHH